MVKTPPCQKRGKCGHFIPQFDGHSSCFGCRDKWKGQDPCAQGANTTPCSACSALTEEQWSHLRENFDKRSAYRQRTSSQDDSFEEPETEDPAQSGEDLSLVDDTLWCAPHATPARQSVADRMAALSFPQPQRVVLSTEIPQTPRTQLIRSQLEQQNFEMMNTLQQKNQQQIQHLSAQWETRLQAFHQQSMEQMFNRLAPAQTQPPAATSTTPPPHIVSITLVSALPPAKSEVPMDSAPSQPAPSEVKKGLTKVKGSSAIVQQSIHASGGYSSQSADFHPFCTATLCTNGCLCSKALISSSGPETRGIRDWCFSFLLLFHFKTGRYYRSWRTGGTP